MGGREGKKKTGVGRYILAGLHRAIVAVVVRVSDDIWGDGKERHRWSAVNQASVYGVSKGDIKILIETQTRLLSVSDALKDVA